MSVNRYDPTTGRPIFENADAPDIKVDPGAAALYAEEVGNRIVKANLAALDAYPYKRQGLMGHALDTNTDYMHDGSGWAVSIRPYGAYTSTVTGLNLSQVTVDAKYEQRGKLIKGLITITRNVAGRPTTSIGFSLPTTPANASAARNLGTGSFYLQNNSTVYIANARYTGGTGVAVNLPASSGSVLAQGSNLSNTFPIGTDHGIGTVIYMPFEYETP